MPNQVDGELLSGSGGSDNFDLQDYSAKMCKEA